MDPNSTAAPAAMPAPTPSAPAAPPAPAAAPAAPSAQGGPDWAQYVSIVLISLTVVSLVVQVSLNRKQYAQIGKNDEIFRKDIAEIRTNVKGILKDKYKTAS